MLRHSALWVALTLLGTLTTAAAAEEPCLERWSEGLFAHSSLVGCIRDVVSLDKDSSRELYFAGDFDAMGEAQTPNIVCYDGSVWTSLGEGLDGTVHDLHFFDDGDGTVLYAAGEFSRSGEVPLHRVGAWNGLNWHSVGQIGGVSVTALASFDDGEGRRLYAVVAMDSNPEGPSRLCRWTGSEWNVLENNITGRVEAMLAWDDGEGEALYLAGSFSRIADLPLNGIARWRDGEWSPLGKGVDADQQGVVEDLAIYDDGNGEALFVVGSFASPWPTEARNIAKWTGATWQHVGDWVNGQPELRAHHLTAHADGNTSRLMIASVDVEGVIAWDGSTATTLGDGVIRGSALAMLDAQYAGATALMVVDALGLLYLTDGTWDLGPTLANGFDSVSVLKTLRFGDTERLYVAADRRMSPYDSGTFSIIADWTGERWERIPPPFPDGPGQVHRVRDLAVYDDGSGPALYATGMFFDESVVPGNIARWDGSKWQPLGSGLEAYIVGWGESLAVYDAGDGPKLYVSGQFTSAGGVPAKNVASWDGTHWQALRTGLPEHAQLFVADTGQGPRLHARGEFTWVDYVEVNHLAAWDGDEWHDLGGGFDAVPRSITAMREGDHDTVYATGDFTTAGGRPCDGFAKWTGSHWLPVAPAPGYSMRTVAALDTPAGPRLYATTLALPGDFWSKRRIMRREGDFWLPLTDDSAFAQAAAVFDDGVGSHLYLTSCHDIDDLASRGIARRNLCDPDAIAADLNADGFIDQADLGLLLAAYDTCAGDDFYDDRADLTGDACVDHADLGAFLQAYPQ